MNAIVVVTKYSLGHSALFGDIVTSLLEMKIHSSTLRLMSNKLNLFYKYVYLNRKILTAGY